MAVKVTLKDRELTSLKPKVDVFDGEDDEYWFEKDHTILKVYRAADGTTKTYMPDSFSTVEGKERGPSI